MAGPKGRKSAARKSTARKPSDTTQEEERGRDPFVVTTGPMADAAQRIVLYGTGGIGKTSLAAMAPNAVIIDLEEGSRELDAHRIAGIETFEGLRACLRSEALSEYSTVVIDSATKAEELAVKHMLATVRNEKGQPVDRIEGYGFGKGYQYLYETFCLLLADLDAVIRRKINVVLVAHDCTENVPNPTGEDFIRYEPALQKMKSGKAPVRNRTIQWADHVLFIGYDVVAEDGKARGSGSRRIYPCEMPTHIAKSRRLFDVIDFESEEDDSLWTALFGGDE